MDKSKTQRQTIQNCSRVALYFLFILISIDVLAIIILGSVPPTSRDALIHHLQIPKLYLQHGGIYEIPDLTFSYYPMNLDLLYMGALHFHNDILPKYIHMLFGLGTAILIYHYLHKRLSTTYALLGALFFLSIPIIVKLSITIYVDLGLIFFSTAALLSLLYWIENKKQRKYLILAAICCGLAMGTKYNGLLILFLLTLFIPILVTRSNNIARQPSRQALQASILFFFIAVLVASPWFIRNSLWTGNPVYPLYDSFFNPPPIADDIAASTDNSNVRGVFATRHVLYGENIVQLLLLPVRIFFEGKDDVPRYFDGRLNPFLLLLPFFAFLRPPTTNRQIQLEKITLVSFCILYFLFAFNTGVLRIRYLAPIVPFLVILSIFGLHNIINFAGKCSRDYSKNAGYVLSSLIITAMLLYNSKYLVEQFGYVQPLEYIRGNLSRDAYITRYRSEYPVIQYANEQPQSNSKTLCLFLGNRGYYMNFPHIFDVPTKQNSFMTQLIAASTDITTIQNSLHQKKFHQILIRNDLMTSWIDNLGENQGIAISFFQNSLELMYSMNEYSLFHIKPTTYSHQETTQ